MGGSRVPRTEMGKFQKASKSGIAFASSPKAMICNIRVVYAGDEFEVEATEVSGDSVKFFVPAEATITEVVQEVRKLWETGHELKVILQGGNETVNPFDGDKL